jgi:hypothetical protein
LSGLLISCGTGFLEAKVLFSTYERLPVPVVEQRVPVHTDNINRLEVSLDGKLCARFDLSKMRAVFDPSDAGYAALVAALVDRLGPL